MGKISIFSNFLENDGKFWRFVCADLRISGATTEWPEKFRDFFETFPPEGAKCFYRGLFKGSLEIFPEIVGAPLAPFDRGKAAT